MLQNIAGQDSEWDTELFGEPLCVLKFKFRLELGLNKVCAKIECGLTKADIRSLSREAGLFTWDKPAYACLATRIPTGTSITAEQAPGAEVPIVFPVP